VKSVTASDQVAQLARSPQGQLILQARQVCYANPAILNLLGYTLADLTRFSPAQVLALVHPDDRPVWVDLLAQEQPGSLFTTLRFVSASGTTHPLGTLASVSYEHGSAIIYITTAAAPVVKLGTHNESTLVQGHVFDREQYESIVELQTDLVCRCSPDYRYTFANQAFCKFLGLSLDAVIGQDVFKPVFAEDIDRVRRNFAALTPETPIMTHENRNFLQGNQVEWYQWTNYGIFDAQGNLQEIQSVGRNITDRKRTEDLLYQAKEQLRAVLDAVPGFISWISQDGKYLGINQSLAHALKISPEEIAGRDVGFLGNSNFVKFIRDFLNSSEPSAQRVLDSEVNQVRTSFLIAAQKYRQGREIVTVGIDVTERQQAAEQIEASLKEKEVLLQEIHHRVKNNLQVISSLLTLQASQLSDREALLAFHEIQGRIRSMALIHQKLYESESLAKIDFAAYIHDLVPSLIHAYAACPDQIKPVIEAQQVYLNLDRAIPCGLLLNELITNAVKHAFPSEVYGTVQVKLQNLSSKLILVVAHDGTPPPAKLNLTTNQSLGLRIVQALVNQIQGQITITQANWTQFQIEFPVVLHK